jgi:hypothetical protein
MADSMTDILARLRSGSDVEPTAILPMSDGPVTGTSLSTREETGVADGPMLDVLARLRGGGQSTGEKISSGVLTAANSALLGVGDEVGAGVNAFIDEGLNFGEGYTDRLGSAYDRWLGTARRSTEQFAEENPKTAFGLEIAGGVSTGLAGAAKAGAMKAPSIASRIIRGAAGGAATGAAAGFGYGEGGLENRAKSAATGGAIGTIFGGAIGGVSGAISSLGRIKAANAARQRFAEMAQSEIGAVGNLPNVKPEKITRAQQFVLNIFKDASDDDILNAAARMESAAKNKTPLTVFEALDVPQGYADAKAIRISRGGRDVAENFLQDRRLGLGQRLGAVLDDISPEKNVLSASEGLKSSANEIVESLERGRTNFVSPFYKKAAEENPVIDSEKINELLELPNVKPVLQEVRKNFPRELPPELPDNHFLVLNELKKGLDDKIAGLKNTDKASNAARALTGIKKELVDEIDNYSPAYKEARDMYQAMSGTIDWLKGSKFAGKKDAGLLEDLLNVNTQKAKEAGSRLMAKTPEQLDEIAQVFKIAGHEEQLRAGVRSAFQSVLDEANLGVRGIKGGSVVDRLFGKVNTKAKLEKILGKEEAEKMWQKIDLEGFIDRGETLIGLDERAIGSPTIPMLETLGEQKSMLRKILTAPRETVSDIIEGLGVEEKEDLTKQIAQELFKTPDVKTFNELLRVQQEYNKTIRLANKAANVVGKSGTKASASTSASAIDRMKDEKGAARTAPLAAVAAGGVAASQAPWMSFLPERSNVNKEKTGGLSSIRNDTAVGFMSPPSTQDRPGVLGTKKNSKMSDKTKEIESLIDQDPVDAAIYEIESGRNPKAKNPESSAAGGFQLLRSMQKSLGVEDPYDLEQNYKGYRKLRAENESIFGSDPYLLYAAHYLGAPTLKKYIDKKPLNAQQKQQIKYLQEKILPKFEKVYTRLASKKKEEQGIKV